MGEPSRREFLMTAAGAVAARCISVAAPVVTHDRAWLEAEFAEILAEGGVSSVADAATNRLIADVAAMYCRDHAAASLFDASLFDASIARTVRHGWDCTVRHGWIFSAPAIVWDHVGVGGCARPADTTSPPALDAIPNRLLTDAPARALADALVALVEDVSTVLRAMAPFSLPLVVGGLYAVNGRRVQALVQFSVGANCRIGAVRSA